MPLTYCRASRNWASPTFWMSAPPLRRFKCHQAFPDSHAYWTFRTSASIASCSEYKLLSLHSVLDGDVGIGGAGRAAGRGRLHQYLQGRARRIVLRKCAAVVGRGGNRDVEGGGAVGKPHDGVGSAAHRRG